MMAQSMKFIGVTPREFPGIGVFRPGQVVPLEESLMQSGLFEAVKERKTKEKEDEA